MRSVIVLCLLGLSHFGSVSPSLAGPISAAIREAVESAGRIGAKAASRSHVDAPNAPPAAHNHPAPLHIAPEPVPTSGPSVASQPPLIESHLTLQVSRVISKCLQTYKTQDGEKICESKRQEIAACISDQSKTGVSPEAATYRCEPLIFK